MMRNACCREKNCDGEVPPTLQMNVLDTFVLVQPLPSYGYLVLGEINLVRFSQNVDTVKTPVCRAALGITPLLQEQRDALLHWPRTIRLHLACPFFLCFNGLHSSRHSKHVIGHERLYLSNCSCTRLISFCPLRPDSPTCIIGNACA